MPCLRLLISGRVQGVWFRESMKREADRLGITGWVRNLADGRVEALIYGHAEAIQAMRLWADKGPTLARVTGVQAEAVPEEPFTGFEKRSN